MAPTFIRPRSCISGCEIELFASWFLGIIFWTKPWSYHITMYLINKEIPVIKPCFVECPSSVDEAWIDGSRKNWLKLEERTGCMSSNKQLKYTIKDWRWAFGMLKTVEEVWRHRSLVEMKAIILHVNLFFYGWSFGHWNCSLLSFGTSTCLFSSYLCVQMVRQNLVIISNGLHCCHSVELYWLESFIFRR